jgi:hypothetical protein
MSYLLLLRLLFILLITGIIPATGNAQLPDGCSALKTGVFYSYPKNTADKYVTYREKGIAKEYDLVKGDSSIWKVDWKDDCTYSLKYVSGSAKLNPEMADFFRKHTLLYTIREATADYYVFNTFLDKLKGIRLGSDTMWMRKKLNHVPTRLFEAVANPQALKKARFSDTSQYAVVYLYRPGKFTNSINADIMVSFDELPIAQTPNKTAYIFKVFQPGNHTFTSRLDKDESKAAVNIEMGKSYYVKSAINWGIYSLSKNYKLEMIIMPEKEGKAEFTEAYY